MIFRKQPDAEPRYTIDDLLLRVNLHPEPLGVRSNCADTERGTLRLKERSCADKTDATISRCAGGIGAVAAAYCLEGGPVQGLATDLDRPLHPRGYRRAQLS